MSGGTFDYSQYQIEDAVRVIKDRLARNGKTVRQLWDERDEEYKARSTHRDWDDLWTYDINQHPYYIDRDAEKKADEALNIRKPGAWKPYDGRLMKELTEAELAEWNYIRWNHVKQEVDAHNDSVPYDNYSPETVAKIREMITVIQKAAIYLQRIDWLLAGDDGEDDFVKRTQEDLEKLERGDDDDC